MAVISKIIRIFALSKCQLWNVRMSERIDPLWYRSRLYINQRLTRRYSMQALSLSHSKFYSRLFSFILL